MISKNKSHWDLPTSLTGTFLISNLIHGPQLHATLAFFCFFLLLSFCFFLGHSTLVSKWFFSAALLGTEIFVDGLINFGPFSMLFLFLVADKLWKMYTRVKRNMFFHSFISPFG